ncbi:MAG TPA: hypothetical protein VM779_08835 [Thermoanaerobaculia bacterium]|nr:hypothetical protein [Thermoanaerobaculia bacterium]
MAAEDGRKGGVHAVRFSSQQRVHLAALLTLVFAFAAPLHAQSVDFDPDITQEEFQKFSRLVAQAIYASPVHPAGASGLLRFDVGIAMTVIDIDTDASYWQLAVGEDFISEYGDYVGVPRLVVSKGVGAATVAGTYARAGDSGIEIWGGSLDIPIMGGGFIVPTLALRGTYSELRGIEIYEQKTYGVEVFLGKGFGPITPYAAYGRMRSDATGTIPATAVNPEIVLHDESDIDRITVGARLSLGVPKLVVEATQAEERSYSAKLSIGF